MDESLDLRIWSQSTSMNLRMYFQKKPLPISPLGRPGTTLLICPLTVSSPKVIPSPYLLPNSENLTNSYERTLPTDASTHLNLLWGPQSSLSKRNTCPCTKSRTPET